MKGLTPQQFAEVLDFVKKYQSFAQWKSPEEMAGIKDKYPLITNTGMNIKYVESTYDSRDHSVWSVGFRHGKNSLYLHTNLEEKWLEGYADFYSLVMGYLKQENPKRFDKLFAEQVAERLRREQYEKKQSS